MRHKLTHLVSGLSFHNVYDLAGHRNLNERVNHVCQSALFYIYNDVTITLTVAASPLLLFCVEDLLQLNNENREFKAFVIPYVRVNTS